LTTETDFFTMSGL